MRNIVILILLLLKMNAYAEELVPLNIYIKKNPAYLTNSLEAEYVANRCGSLMTILANRTREAYKTKEIVQIADEYNRKGNVCSIAGLMLSMSPVSSEKKYIDLHKALLMTYSNLTLKNWKSGNMFKGLIEQDLETCTVHKTFYEKLSKSLR